MQYGYINTKIPLTEGNAVFMMNELEDKIGDLHFKVKDRVLQLSLS